MYKLSLHLTFLIGLVFAISMFFLNLVDSPQREVNQTVREYFELLAAFVSAFSSLVVVFKIFGVIRI